jgi:magnesium-transporting ATPase (P-type)
MMSVLVQGADGKQLLLTKGAPESVLSRCSSALANAEAAGAAHGGSGASSSGVVTSGRGIVPLTDGMRRALLERMGQYGGERAGALVCCCAAGWAAASCCCAHAHVSVRAL